MIDLLPLKVFKLILLKPIALRMAKTLWSFDLLSAIDLLPSEQLHSEQPQLWNFDLSESKKVKSRQKRKCTDQVECTRIKADTSRKGRDLAVCSDQSVPIILP